MVMAIKTLKLQKGELRRCNRMKSKLILVEGISGSGKTTLSQKLGTWYQDHNIPVKLYNEGIANPICLAWCAYVPIIQYHELLQKYDRISDRIRERTVIEGEYAIVEYTQVHRGQNFYDELQNYEIYGGRVSDNKYFEITTNRWQTFGNKNHDECSIMKSAFLQNTIMELLFYRCIDESAITSHAKKLIDYVKSLHPVVIYLSQPDIRNTIQHVADERSDWNWINIMVDYCEKTPYARKKGISGFDGIIEMLEERKQLEKNIFSQLQAKTAIIENTNNDWDAVWESILEAVRHS